MGSIGPDPSEMILTGYLFTLIITIIAGWILYQYKIMRVVFCVATFLLSSILLAYYFSHPSLDNYRHRDVLFFTSISLCYAFSACYLAKRHFIIPMIWLTSMVYLLAASLITLYSVFNMNYEVKILEKLMSLSVEIACLLYVPISVIIILQGYLKVDKNSLNQ